MFVYFLLFLALLGVLVLLTRPVTTILHELGHAIAALLLTRKQVTVYIGTYGETKNTVRIPVGKHIIYFRYNPFGWHAGLCVVGGEELAYSTDIIITLAGPFASLITATIALYYTFTYDLHGSLKLFLIVFLFSSIADLLANIIPSKEPAILDDGREVYNDGMQLLMIMRYRKLNKYYARAIDLYNQQQYDGVLEIVDMLIAKNLEHEEVFRLGMHAAMFIKANDKAIRYAEELQALDYPDANDRLNHGSILLALQRPQEALEVFEKMLVQQPDNIILLNNMGYTLGLLDRFEEAIDYLDKAILLDAAQPFPYNNRGLARIKTGQTVDGLRDIFYSMELDPTNAYTHKYLGIYHFDRGEYDDALRLFTKAKDMDATTYRIDDHILQTKTLLAGKTPL